MADDDDRGGHEENDSDKRSEIIEELSEGNLREWQRYAADEEGFRTRLFFHLEAERRLRHEEIREALNESMIVGIDRAGWNRIVDYQYSLEPLSPVGSLFQGGRFNIGNDIDGDQFRAFPALYVAGDYATAFRECFGSYESGPGQVDLSGAELALREPESFASCRLALELQRVFDLTVETNLEPFAEVMAKITIPPDLRALGRKLKFRGPLNPATAKRVRHELTSLDWRYLPVNFELPAYPQVFGRMLVDAGFEGVLFRSTKGEANCVAVFPNRLLNESCVRLVDAPPDDNVQTRLDADNLEALMAPALRGGRRPPES